VVISEETGLISLVMGGEIQRGLDAVRLKSGLLEALEVEQKEPEPLPAAAPSGEKASK
jgi:hypothetical protein